MPLWLAFCFTFSNTTSANPQLSRVTHMAQRLPPEIRLTAMKVIGAVGYSSVLTVQHKPSLCLAGRLLSFSTPHIWEQHRQHG